MRVSSTYEYSKIHCRTNQSFLRNGKVCVYSCEFPCICIESDGIYMGPYDITQNLFIVFILLSTLLRNHFTLHICFRVVGRDSSKGQILLNSHYDVVPVQEEDWTVPAFDGLRLDGKVYGRGTQDMKCVCIQVVVHLFSPSSPSSPSIRLVHDSYVCLYVYCLILPSHLSLLLAITIVPVYRSHPKAHLYWFCSRKGCTFVLCA